MADNETPLSGGRVTKGVMRVGDTVRRPVSGDRTTARRLLEHLEKQDFIGVPRYLGLDPQGREILSYLEGSVPADLDHFSDRQLAAAASLLRKFHYVTESLDIVQVSGGEVMCHNDWGPPNAVFRKGLPYGLIDFDTVRPGPRLWDLGYSLFAWLDLGNDVYSGLEQLRRLRVFVDVYGHPGCTAETALPYVVMRQTGLAATGRVQGKLEMANWAAAAASWTVLNVAPLLLPMDYLLSET